MAPASLDSPGDTVVFLARRFGTASRTISSAIPAICGSQCHPPVADPSVLQHVCTGSVWFAAGYEDEPGQRLEILQRISGRTHRSQERRLCWTPGHRRCRSLPGHERWDGRILRERFQIEIKTIPGSVADETSFGHRDGYNSISIREIDRRIGWDRVQAARSEALQQQYDGQEQSVKELTKRLSSIPPDAKVTTQLIRPYVDNFPLKDPAVEQQLALFVHAVEQSVMDAVPEDTPAFQLNISVKAEPNSRPSFQISGSPNSPPSVSQAIWNNLEAMPSPEWTKGSLSVAFDFLVRSPR